MELDENGVLIKDEYDKILSWYADEIHDDVIKKVLKAQRAITRKDTIKEIIDLLKSKENPYAKRADEDRNLGYRTSRYYIKEKSWSLCVDSIIDELAFLEGE